MCPIQWALTSIFICVTVTRSRYRTFPLPTEIFSWHANYVYSQRLRKRPEKQQQQVLKWLSSERGRKKGQIEWMWWSKGGSHFGFHACPFSSIIFIKHVLYCLHLKENGTKDITNAVKIIIIKFFCFSALLR